MIAQDVYKTVSSRIQDLTTPRRWPWDDPATTEDPSLQDFLNNALLNVALQRPDATATLVEATLIAGPRQTLASDELSLLECIEFISADESVKRAVTRIDRSEMDAFLVDWYSEETDSDGVWNWAYEKLSNPLVYWVSPGAAAGDKMKQVVSKRPVKVTSAADDLEISELFKPALDAWVLYELLSSDTDEFNPQKAMHFHQSFYQILGVKIQADMAFPVKVREGSNVS